MKDDTIGFADICFFFDGKFWIIYVLMNIFIRIHIVYIVKYTTTWI